MADDMGFSDISCYGGGIHTPNIDSLAENGLKFNRFYNAARCCPSRASLMTGLYPHKTGLGWMTACDMGRKGYSGELRDDCQTLPEALKKRGYKTYMCGKWHLTRYDHLEQDSPKNSWPCQRGFDKYYGTLRGAGSYFEPPTLTSQNTLIDTPEDFYYTDAMTDKSVEFINQHRKTDENSPFFLYLAYTAPHWPLHAKENDIRKYKSGFEKGWDKLRNERYQRLKDLGIIKKDWELSKLDEKVRRFNQLGEKKKDEMTKRMEIYAAQIHSMDKGIGRIVTTLKKRGILENTLIMFLSDNGPSAEGGNWGFNRIKGGKLGTAESFSSYGRSWANLSNTPFKKYKLWTYEGGISTPFIARWKAGIKNCPRSSGQVAHIIDIAPTCLSAAKGNIKFDSGDLDGKSLLPVFTGSDIGSRTLFWEHESNRAVIDGDWKLLASGKDDNWKLYNLKNDRTELNDLSAKYPHKVKKMEVKWNNWAKRNNVLPLDDRSWSQRVNDAKDK